MPPPRVPNQKKPYVSPSVQSLVIPPKPSVRLDVPTRVAIAEYMEANDMSFSQALRTLIAVALRDEESADEVFRRQAFREGVIRGVGAMKERMAEAIESALGDLE